MFSMYVGCNQCLYVCIWTFVCMYVCVCIRYGSFYVCMPAYKYMHSKYVCTSQSVCTVCMYVARQLSK